VIENQKKERKYGSKSNFYLDVHPKNGLGMEIIACLDELMPEETPTSVTISDAHH